MRTNYPEANGYYGCHSRKVGIAGIVVFACLALAGLVIGLSLMGCACRDCKHIAQAERRAE